MVVLSSLGADVGALSNALDLSARYQSYIFEILTGQFYRDLQSPSDTLPMINTCLFGRNRTSLDENRMPMPETSIESNTMPARGNFCDRGAYLDANRLKDR